jgi:hypothetical protein
MRSALPVLGHHVPAGEPVLAVSTYETLIFFGLALAIGAFTVWWVRRLA